MWSWLTRLFGGKAAPSPTPDPLPPPAAAARPPEPEPVLGIDLGTSRCRAAAVLDGEPRLVPLPGGDCFLPAAVARVGGDWVVGVPALQHAELDPRRTLRGVKRLLGRRRDQAPADPHPGPEVVEGLGGQARVQLDGEPCPPAQLAALLLRRLRQAAEAHLGRPVRRAVLAVPPTFTLAQRRAALDAARIAGFSADWDLTDPGTGKTYRTRLRLVSEPVAAGLAFAARHREAGKFVVLDLGAAHLGCAVLDVGDGVVEVRALHG